MAPKQRREPGDYEILIATDSGVWMSPEGSEFYYYKDVTRIRAGHPLAKAIPGSFRPIDVHYDIEAMSAAPGELRGEPNAA